MGAKQNWIMPLLAALVVACVGWWADSQLHSVMQEELADDLRTMLNADVTALEIWMANQKRIAAVLAEEPRLRNLAVELLDKGGVKATNQMALAILSRQLIIGDRLQARLKSMGYTVAQLVNTNCEVVLDSGRVRSHMGAQVADDLQPRYDELFASGELAAGRPRLGEAARTRTARAGTTGRGRPVNQRRQRSARTDGNAGGRAAQRHQRGDAWRAGLDHQPGRGVHPHPLGRALRRYGGNLRI
jgi:hypothetical protein